MIGAHITYDQTLIQARDANGDTEQFFFGIHATYDDALALASEWAQSKGGYGYIVLMGRNRLNDHVGAPIWSEPQVIEEL